MKRIDIQNLGNFEYQRFEFASRWLGRDETLSIIRPRGVDRPKATLHYFHAGFADDRMLREMELVERLDDETQALLTRRGVQLVSGSYGMNFLLTSQDDPKRPISEYFFKEIIPLSEEGTDTTAETRFMTGASLGGHSALVAFARHPELFGGVASTIGALMNFDFHDDEAFARYAREARVSNEYAGNLKAIFRGFFESYDVYRKADPMRMVRAADPASFRGKRILIETGSDDDFGFHAGMQEFSELLKSLDIPHRFDFVEGGKHEPVFVMSRFPKMLQYLFG